MIDAIESSVVICGLPASGKTTYLAALWHVVIERTNPDAVLKFDTLKDGDHAHLQAIARRWRQAKVQIHTETSSGKIVSMKLKDAAGRKVRMTFPDLSGESYQQIWEARECAPELAKLLQEGNGILLFIHADKIKAPMGVAEISRHAAGLANNGTPEESSFEEWHPKDAPTAVQLVEILQMLRSDALRAPARKLAVVFSAWDKVEEEEVSPEELMTRDLPLLDQYLRYGLGDWEVRIYGLSAQGGEYEEEGAAKDVDRDAKVAEIRAVSDAANRIRLLTPELSTDLTEPIAWLTQ